MILAKIPSSQIKQLFKIDCSFVFTATCKICLKFHCSQLRSRQDTEYLRAFGSLRENVPIANIFGTIFTLLRFSQQSLEVSWNDIVNPYPYIKLGKFSAENWITASKNIINRCLTITIVGDDVYKLQATFYKQLKIFVLTFKGHLKVTQKTNWRILWILP